MSCQRCKQPQLEVYCSQCKLKTCSKCAISNHIEKHYDKVSIICQQCQQNSSGCYCQNCQQHLCLACSQKIHNKGKRAKHQLIKISQILFVRECYIIYADALINKQGYLEQLLSQIVVGNDNTEKLILVQLEQPFNSKRQYIFQTFKISELTLEQIVPYLSTYPFINKINVIDSIFGKKMYEKLVELPLLSQVKLTKVPKFQADSNDSFAQSSSINISTSTQNSLRKRTKKNPIPYFQPWVSSKNDPRRLIEQRYRDLANNGILMLRTQNKDYPIQNITRIFSRNISQCQIQYISMCIDTISIQSLCWVIRSIKADQMTPSQKLILSRLKQSFDYKISSKLWLQIIRYLQSNLYIQDKMAKDPNSIYPSIIVETQGDQNFLYFQGEQWEYQDQGKVIENSIEWKQFVELINDYFTQNTQIGGGRYGCVQYVKLKSQKPLNACSLGKLSLFVQQAINRGIIRYHKTLLVSNNDSQSFINNNSLEADVKLMQLQKDVKIIMLQLALINMFLDCGKNTSISLAQIPLNLKKNVPFQVNLIELGFPKLKNLLVTLSDKLYLQSTKSHISYQTHYRTPEYIEQLKTNLYQMRNTFLGQIFQYIAQIISYYHNVVVQQLEIQLNQRIGFIFDYRVFNSSDFSQFLAYYCPHLVDIQFISGIFIAYQKGYQSNLWIQQQQNPQTLTPKFNSSIQYQHKKINTFKWQSYQDIIPADQDNDVDHAEEQQESYSDYRSIYNILQDESENKSHPKTVIQKQGSQIQNQLFLSKITPIDQKSDKEDKSFGFGQLDLMQQQMKSPRAHNRVYSNTPFESKPQHSRVSSTISRN